MRRIWLFMPIVCACASAPAPAPAPTPTPSASAAPEASVAPPDVASPPEASPPPAPASSAPTKTAQGLVAVNDVMAPKEFDPNPILKSLRPKLTDCYKAALAQSPSLHGKMKTRVVVLESGKVDRVEDAGKSTIDDASLQSCAFDTIKAATFPKPGGTATITFTLFFH